MVMSRKATPTSSALSLSGTVVSVETEYTSNSPVLSWPLTGVSRPRPGAWDQLVRVLGEPASATACRHVEPGLEMLPQGMSQTSQAN